MPHAVSKRISPSHHGKRLFREKIVILHVGFSSRNFLRLFKGAKSNDRVQY